MSSASPHSTDATRILFVGDMHLGRLPGSLPESLPVAELGPRAAWARVVQAAQELGVHCVALAGDLVQGENAMFEAYGPLENGIRELSAAGIQVVAVAGNHDTEVLPVLADQIDGCHLLGPNGTWSACTVKSGGGPDVRLVGWSFPATHHHQSPLEGAELPSPDPRLPTLGLLHADLVAGGVTAYAPVTARDLQQVGYDGWFLGHIHQPDEPPPDGAPFYLGSVTALTPNERGLHGPVLCEITADGARNLRRLPLAPLRWEELQLDCTGRADLTDNLQAFLTTSIAHHYRRLAGQLGEVRALGLRVVLTGRVADPVGLSAALDRLAVAGLETQQGRLATFVQKITSRVRGDFDLENLAQSDHPAGVLARQLLLLRPEGGTVPGVDDPQAARRELLHLARQEVQQVDRRNQFATLAADQEDAPPGDAELAELLTGVAGQALAHLLAGKEGDLAAD